jgi:hypothetical protein
MLLFALLSLLLLLKLPLLQLLQLPPSRAQVYTEVLVKPWACCHPGWQLQ